MCLVLPLSSLSTFEADRVLVKEIEERAGGVLRTIVKGRERRVGLPARVPLSVFLLICFRGMLT